MGVAYAEVEYEVLGRRYRTVHGLGSDATASQNTFGLADYTEWGGDLVNDANFDAATDPAENTQDPRSIIEAILFFHRYMQRPEVILRNLSLNDGPTPGTSTGNFVSLNLDLQCRGNAVANGGDLAGLNNTMMITKQPGEFSRRKGRMFLRGAFAAGHIVGGDADGVTFKAGQRSLYESELYEATVGTGLGDSQRLRHYFLGALGANGTFDVYYVIPNTIKVAGTDPETGQPVTKRILQGYTDVQGMQVTDAQSRDTRRKKKSK